MTTEAEKAAELAELDAALTVNCPACIARAGQRCWNMVTGQPSNIVHAGRVDRWKHPRRRWQ
jgi:hypothetical protein